MSCFKTIFCCQCSRCCRTDNPLESINQQTRLLPKTAETKKFFEKNEITFFGGIDPLLKDQSFTLDAISKQNLKKIVCGNNHVLLLFNDGKMAICGSNDQGQLGLEIKKDKNFIGEIRMFNEPIEKNVNYQVLDIAAGDNFSLILVRVSNKDTFVYKLGLQLEDRYSEEAAEATNIKRVRLDYDTHKVTQVYAFGKRSLLVTQAFEILVGGLDFNLNSIKKYKVVDSFPKEIATLSMGTSHVLLLDSTGGLYSFGDNTYGELGIDGLSTIDKPTKVTFFDQIQNDQIKKICAGARHSTVLMESGTVYAFGDNSTGQCTGSSIRYTKPTKITWESREKIIDVFSSYEHSVLITNLGNLYSWGDTSNGKLGYTDGNLMINYPKEIQILKGKNVSMIAIGEVTTVVTTSSYENSIQRRHSVVKGSKK